MSVVIGVTAAIIVIATFLAARGLGGELARFPRDLPEFSFQPRSSADLLSLELPLSLFGFSEHATAAALNAVGRLLAAREAEAEYLRAELRRVAGPPGRAGTGEEPAPAGTEEETMRPAGAADPDGRGNADAMAEPGGPAEVPTDPLVQPGP